MYNVVKRDGKVVDFKLYKIENAIEGAFKSQNEQYNNDIICSLALRATSDLKNKEKDGLVTVEDIQDSVEKTLGNSGYSDVAKAYILYR